MSAARDASWFFDELYRDAPQPSVIALAFKTTRGLTSRFPLTTADAAKMVLGCVDAYHRVTLLEHQPPRGKRADETASIAFPGVALDLDVNGSPDGRGGTITGAFPTIDAAVDVAAAVLEPTIVVASGYGVQPYWLLDEMLPLAGDEDRVRAKLLGRRLHARLRQEADARGVKRCDSVFDLARILRPPGSLNGKGTEPRPVRLLDDGGPRYTLDQLTAAGIDVDDDRVRQDHDAGAGRALEQLLAEFPRLAAIARREGKPPKNDSTPSGWDFYLACQAIRDGLSDGEIATLIRYARRDDRKGARGDYIEHTIANARAKVTDVNDGADVDGPARISRRWNIADDPIVAGDTLGDVATGDAIVYLTRRSGHRLRFPRLGDLYEPRTHNRIVSGVTRSRFPPLSVADALDITQRIIELCGGEDADPLAEPREWVTEFLAHAGEVIDAVRPNGDPKPRWDVMRELELAEVRLEAGRDVATRSAIVRGSDGRWWLPAGALKSYAGARLSWPQFTVKLAEIGWQHVEVDVREPATRDDRAAGKARRIHRNFYVGSD